MRPDLEVHVLCESAGSAQDKFQVAMCRALVMDAGSTKRRILKSQAAQWAAMPRRRVLLATLPYVA
eukprot:6230284-Lingulodinium_polyedra.AAC.1